MTYEELMMKHHDVNSAGLDAYIEWQKNVAECLCLEIGFDNKEIMYYVFEKAYFICSYLSHDGVLDADDVYAVVEEFIDFYKKVAK